MYLKSIILYLWMGVNLLRCVDAFSSTGGFVVYPSDRIHRPSTRCFASGPSVVESNSKSSPRTGLSQTLLNFALSSPLWKLVLVPQARQKMINTAAENGIPWEQCKGWLAAQDGPWQDGKLYKTENVPEYYLKEFHAYDEGNLCWESALEVEIAAASVGARNFPKYGKDGEIAFRASFGVALDEAGADCKKGATIVDLGCGTGMSTRWLASRYPQAGSVLGIDMSEYFISVGQRLLELQPDENIWVSKVTADPRISYRQGDASSTGLPEGSADIVVLQFVAHELPYQVTIDIIREASRILKPDGQFWFCEMDFEAPAYAAQRANALLFSLIRSTEPYLDDYADHAAEIQQALRDNFSQVTLNAATGRHFSVVARKGGSPFFEDNRFDAEGNYRVEDTHLKVFENKS